MKRFIIILLVLMSSSGLFLLNSIEVKALSTDQNMDLDTAKSVIIDNIDDDVDFIYDMSLNDSINVIYNHFSISDLILSYMKSKISNNVSCTINLDNLKYRLTVNSQSYTGKFKYNLGTVITLNSRNDVYNQLYDLFSNYLGNSIKISQQTQNTYSICKDNICSQFDIVFTDTNNFTNDKLKSSSRALPDKADVYYQACIMNYGCQDVTSNGEIGGTTGKNRGLEAIAIAIKNSSLSGDIVYQTHVSNIGWQNEVTNGELAGTIGQGNNIEAIRIKLTGELSAYYDIYYRVHTTDMGWLAWTSNGNNAGTSGFARKIEAIQVKLVKKGETPPDTNGESFVKKDLSVRTNVTSIGWQPTVYNNEYAGTTGQNKGIQAIQLSLSDMDYSGDIVYQTHVSNIGWQNEVTNGELAGTIGQGNNIEAIRIKLTGELSAYYDIYYRVHTTDMGWLAWTSNGNNAGTSGFARKIEAIQVKLVKKGETPPDTNGESFVKKDLSVRTNVTSIGWQPTVYNNEYAGTTGQNKGIQAIQLSLSDMDYAGDIVYQAYVSNIGWQNEVKNGELAGTIGQGNNIETIRIKLTGEISAHYDIYYRVHTTDMGWLAWTSNGNNAGTAGFGRKIEAIQVKLVKKGETTPDTSGNSYIEKEAEVIYQAHVTDMGWQDEVKNGVLIGTTGQNKGIEAIQIRLSSLISGNIKYQTYVTKSGWQDIRYNGQLSGTTGQANFIEGIKISLDGDMANFYDIYYRSHVSNLGWLDWACNGQPSGSTGVSQKIEAIEIKLVAKNGTPPSNTQNPYAAGEWVNQNNNTYYYDAFGRMAGDFITIDGTKYFFNSLGVLIGSDVKKVIDVSAWQETIDWDTVKKVGDIDAVILRVAAGSLYEDSMLETNVEALNRLGIPYGIYLYSYAEDVVSTVEGLGTMKEGALEAERIIQAIKKYNMNLSLPIYYDLEKWGKELNYANKDWDVAYYKKIIEAFDERMTAAGYDWKIYTNKEWADTKLNDIDIRNKIDWIAQYNHYCTYTGNYSGWQFSSTEKIAGIPFDENDPDDGVDVSVWFN